MKKLLFALSIIFVVLTFVGAVLVLKSGGTKNAGYAVVPMVLAMACSVGCKSCKK